MQQTIGYKTERSAIHPALVGNTKNNLVVEYIPCDLEILTKEVIINSHMAGENYVSYNNGVKTSVINVP